MRVCIQTKAQFNVYSILMLFTSLCLMFQGKSRKKCLRQFLRFTYSPQNTLHDNLVCILALFFQTPVKIKGIHESCIWLTSEFNIHIYYDYTISFASLEQRFVVISLCWIIVKMVRLCEKSAV